MKHVLSNGRLTLERYTWRHKKPLGVKRAEFKEKIEGYTKGEYQKVETWKDMLLEGRGRA